MADYLPATLQDVQATIQHKSKKRTVTGWRQSGSPPALSKIYVSRHRLSTNKWERLGVLAIASPSQQFWRFVDTANIGDDVVRYTFRAIRQAGGAEESVVSHALPAGIRTPPKPPVLVKAVRTADNKITITYGNPSWAAQYIRVLVAATGDGGKTYGSTVTAAEVTAPAPSRSASNPGRAIWRSDHTVTVTVATMLGYKVMLQAVATNPGYSTESGFGEMLANSGWSGLIRAAYTVPSVPSLLVASPEWPDDTKYRFAWDHKPTDGTAQTGAQVEYRPVGGSAIQLTVTGAGESAETAAPLAAGDWECRARTRGAGGGYGDWSGWYGFRIVGRPALTIVTPADGVTVTGNRCKTVLEWSSPSGATIRDWGARLKRGAVIVEEKSGTKPVTSVTFAAALSDATTYTVEVWATGSNNITAVGDSNTFPVAYLRPGVPTITSAAWDEENGTVHLALTNAGIPPGGAATVANALEVSRDGGTTWTACGDDIPASAGTGSILDQLAPLGVDLLYRVLAISALDVRIPSTPIAVTTRPARDVWLVGADGARCRIRLNIRLQVSHGQEMVLEQYHLREKPTAHYGDARPTKVQVSGTALYEQGQADDWTVLLGQAVHYRDPDGRAFWSTLDATGPSHSSDWARSHSIDLTVEETDYEP